MDVPLLASTSITPPVRMETAGVAPVLTPDATSARIPNPVNSSETAQPSNGHAPLLQTHVTQAVRQTNDAFQQLGQNLRASFEKDKATGISIVKIVDKRTNETIRQMPPKEIVELARFLDHPQGMRGSLLDTTA
jgi:flagellar protein FlaG